MKPYITLSIIIMEVINITTINTININNNNRNKCCCMQNEDLEISYDTNTDTGAQQDIRNEFKFEEMHLTLSYTYVNH